MVRGRAVPQVGDTCRALGPGIGGSVAVVLLHWSVGGVILAPV